MPLPGETQVTKKPSSELYPSREQAVWSSHEISYQTNHTVHKRGLINTFKRMAVEGRA